MSIMDKRIKAEEDPSNPNQGEPRSLEEQADKIRNPVMGDDPAAPAVPHPVAKTPEELNENPKIPLEEPLAVNDPYGGAVG